MNDNPELTGTRNPPVSILLTLLTVGLGFQFVGPLLGGLIAAPLYPGTLQEFTQAFKDPFAHPEFRQSLFLMQGFGTLVGMIILPTLFLTSQRRSLGELFKTDWYAQPVVIVIVLVIVFMGVNSIFVEWNQGIRFPGDSFFREMEEKLAEGTKFLTQFDSTGGFILAFIVIAVLPAIGEELVFRGMIQNDFYRATRNIHVSIWVSAILFSAIHLQFFGFVPRMLLGALFGYIYYWSGSLWLAVLAHFVNNGFTLIGLYLYQQKVIEIDLENTSSVPIQGVLISAVLSGVLIYMFKTFWDKKPKPGIPD